MWKYENSYVKAVLVVCVLWLVYNPMHNMQLASTRKFTTYKLLQQVHLWHGGGRLIIVDRMAKLSPHVYMFESIVL